MGWEQLLQMKKAAEEEARAAELVERTDCPECAWPLDKHPDGTLHCGFCGWTDRLGVR